MLTRPSSWRALWTRHPRRTVTRTRYFHQSFKKILDVSKTSVVPLKYLDLLHRTPHNATTVFTLIIENNSKLLHTLVQCE